MKRSLCIWLALCLALCAAGCGDPHAPEGATLALYCPAEAASVGGGDILTTVSVDWNEQVSLAAEEQSRAAVELLLGGCTEPAFASPVPPGTRLLGCTALGRTVTVDLSAAYGQLSGMELTVADYCLVLTLTQIPGVHIVRILVEGRELPYRASNTLLAGDALLTSREDAVRTFAARLYFSGAEGQLQGEDRLLTLYEGQSRGAVLMDALLAGPDSSGLQALLPPEFAVLSVWMEQELCYLNLPSSDEALLPPDEAEQTKLLQSVVRSLCSISGVSQVQVLIDGEMRGTFGTLDVSQPLTGI